MRGSIQTSCVFNVTEDGLRYKLLTLVSSVDPDEDLRPDWIKRVIFDVHFLDFGSILFLIVVVAVVAISLLTEPIPQECVSALSSQPDMSMDPKVRSMIPEDLSTICSIGSMIQSDPMVKFLSRFWIPLDPSVMFGIGSRIPSDP